MHHIDVIRKFKTPQFTVVVEAIEDDFLDLSFDDTGEVAEKLETGEYINFAVKASVYFRGLTIGDDFLGGCIYRNLDEFADHRICGKQNREYAAKGEVVRCGSYFHDMIRTAIKDARNTLSGMQKVKIRV